MLSLIVTVILVVMIVASVVMCNVMTSMVGVNVGLGGFTWQMIEPSRLNKSKKIGGDLPWDVVNNNITSPQQKIKHIS
jgi:hypothetical protein